MFVSRKFSRFPKAKHMQSLISELSWSRWRVFGGERASSNTSSTKAFFFFMLQKQIPREGFPHIWPFLGLRKTEVLKITSSNIHRFDINVARNLGWIEPAVSWKMKKTEQIKCSRSLTLWVSHGAPLATMKEKMQTCKGYLLVCVPENRQACSLGSSGVIQ